MPEEAIFSVEDLDIAALLANDGITEDLNAAYELLFWDEEICMPQEASEIRALQLATLQVMLHKMETLPEIGVLLAKLRDRLEDPGFTEFDRALVRRVSKNYEKSRKLPSWLVDELSKASSSGYESWKRARAESDFALFEENLKRIVELKIEETKYLVYKESPYDALLDKFEEGLTQKEMERLFEPLVRELPGILADYARPADPVCEAFLKQKPDTHILEKFVRELVAAMGFDFKRGRLDAATHPFTIGAHPFDARITTRYTDPAFIECVFSGMHEAGHALYMQGVDPRLSRTSLGGSGITMGLHESQSMFFEYCIGKSMEFWEFWHPKLAAALARAGQEALDFTRFMRAINRVSTGFIRVNADEVTYGLHIALRFEIEKELFSGGLAVHDIPEAWKEKSLKYLGVAPDTDALGCLQDMHWSDGSFGYFPVYALGQMLSAQLLHTMKREFPDFDGRIASGELTFAKNWLNERVHRHGAAISSKEIIVGATGEELNPNYLLDYLRGKMGRIWGQN